MRLSETSYKFFFNSMFFGNNMNTGKLLDLSKIKVNKKENDNMKRIRSLLENIETNQTNKVDTLEISDKAREMLNSITPNKAAVEKFANETHEKLMENLKDAGDKIKFSNDYVSASKLYQGKSINYTDSDVVFNYRVESNDEKAYNRQMINNQISNILDENGIKLDDEITFEIEPYDYKISAYGTDKETRLKIEEVLNKGENGVNLYTHIYYCSNEQNSTQLSDEGQLKRYVQNFVEEKTGYDLRECTKTDDDFITKDGKSIKQLLHDNVDNDKTEIYKDEAKKACDGYINQVMKYDYNDGVDQKLRISYNSKTGLQDIMQDKGYGIGKTDWIKDVANSFEKTAYTTFL